MVIDADGQRWFLNLVNWWLNSQPVTTGWTGWPFIVLINCWFNWWLFERVVDGECSLISQITSSCYCNIPQRLMIGSLLANQRQNGYRTRSLLSPNRNLIATETHVVLTNAQTLIIFCIKIFDFRSQSQENRLPVFHARFSVYFWPFPKVPRGHPRHSKAAHVLGILHAKPLVDDMLGRKSTGAKSGDPLQRFLAGWSLAFRLATVGEWFVNRWLHHSSLVSLLRIIHLLVCWN